MAETNKFTGILAASIVLVALASIVLLGIAVINQYQDILLDSMTVGNESVTTSSQTVTLANDDLTTFTFFGNDTISTNTPGIDIDEEVNWTNAGVVTVSGLNFSDANYNASYTYDAENAGSNAAGSFVVGLSIFGSFVGVLAISIIGFAIISLFKKK